MESAEKKPASNRFTPYLIILLLGVLIAAAGFVFHQSFFRMLPLFVSLVISYLQSKVSRFAPLLGSVNSILYAVVYYHYALYASAAYAVLFSFPLQLITFLRWQKRRWRSSTVFRRLSARQRIGLAVLFAVVWIVVYAVLKSFGSDFALLDNTLSLLGILTSFLMIFACIEYTALMVVSSFINVILYAVMLPKHPEQVTYLIYSVYCFVCQLLAFRSAHLAYREQSAETYTQAEDSQENNN